MFMGNDDVCDIKRIGIIHLKMHNGIVKTLTEVRYVPDLKKNLFSFEVLKAICGVLDALKCTRKGNLYFLDRSTVTGRVVVSKSFKDDEADNSRLWHVRLRHAGEKAL